MGVYLRIPPPPPKQRRYGLLIAIVSILCLALALGGLLFGITHASVQQKVIKVFATPTVTPKPKPTPQPTILVETPTPALSTPVPVINTAQDIYTQFTDANIAMGNAGDVEHSWWLQCCSYYPGRGSISFVDEASSGSMIIALFNSANGLQTDVTQLASRSNHPGDYYLGSCLLLYWDASTNLTPYEQVMQQYC